MAKFVVTLKTGVVHEVEADQLTYHGGNSIQFHNVSIQETPTIRDGFGNNRMQERQEAVAWFSDVQSAMRVI